MNKMYLVSSCLAGLPVRYDGSDAKSKEVMELVKMGQAVLVCPEQLGGLPTPRPCCEMRLDDENGARVYTKEGRDVTEEFKLGAQKSLQLAKSFGIKKAILKSKSPSCGLGKVYDGTFSGKLVDGNGIFAKLLLDNGIEVKNED